MKAKAKPAGGQPTLVVDSEVARQIRQHARSNSKTEICGVLIGRDRDHRIEIAACIEGQNAEGAGAHVTFTQDTWEHIYAVKDKKYPDERIVGWYHSHPGFGVFLSDHDTFIHKNFFSSPGQVAWVFDPHSDEEGCFGWVNGSIERLTRIGVVDGRGGERASESGRPEPVVTSGADQDMVAVRQEEREASPVSIRKLEAEESSEESGLSLESLVANVFLYLTVLALGFALSWYFFPHLVAVPVLMDPRTGQLIDPRTGQVLADPKDSGGADPAKPDPSRSGQPAAPNPGGQKGDDARPK